MQRTHLQTKAERVRQLRLNMMVHSYLYYKLDTQIISDHQWQAMADELTARQADHYPVIGCYDDAFRDWDGSTGYHLPFDAWTINKAQYLLRITGREVKPKRVQISTPPCTSLLF